MWHLLLGLLFYVSLCVTPLHATFILDDFDDTAELVAPEQIDVDVISENVGALGARRSMVIGGLLAEPSATLDANATTTSHLTAIMTDINATDIKLPPLVAMAVGYEFSPHDFTEGGINNALLLDFSSIAGPTPPALLGVFFRDATNVGSLWFAAISPVSASSMPATIAIPFSSFGNRAGGAGGDFSSVNDISFNFSANQVGELGWTVKLDRIRVGRIPEPGSLGLICIGCHFFSWMSQRPSFRCNRSKNV